MDFTKNKEDFEKCIKAIYGIDSVHENMYNAWKTAKSQFLFDVFGDKLKVEKEIYICEDPEYLKGKIRTWFFDVLVKSSPMTVPILQELLTEEEATNGVLGEDKWLSVDKVIKTGSKVSKLIRELVPPNKYDEVCTEYSKVMQTKRMKGTLVLSIDPLDYLTASYNTLGWRSCYHPVDGGSRGAWNAWANSDVAMIAYIKSNSNPTCNFEHTGVFIDNKKWRTWVSILPNFVHINKGYPYQSTELNEAVFDFVSELLGKNYCSRTEKKPSSTMFIDTGKAYNDTLRNDTWIRKFTEQVPNNVAIASEFTVNPINGAFTKNVEDLRSFDYLEYGFNEFTKDLGVNKFYREPNRRYNTLFKAGDTVRVMSVEQMCQMYGDVRSKGVPRVTFGWCKDMEAFVGKEFIITRVGGDGAVYGLSEVDDSRFTLHTDMIEYVNNDWKAISA